jgi:peptide/nickel transport system substrate-binding protein
MSPLTRRAILGAAAGAPLAALAAAAEGATLNAMMATEPPTLNYPLYNYRLTQEICGNINESLLLFDWQFRPHPNLARAFTVSPDARTYTFYLQPGVRWHDGMPFSARDVVFSSDVMLRQLNTRSRAALSHCESIGALDDLTVEYRLRQPFNAFLLSFMASSGPMMPAHIYEGTDFHTNPFNFKPVGTGPFRFREWVRGEYVRLERNPQYWRPGRPMLKEIYFRVVPAAEQRLVALETGAVDIGFGDAVDPVVLSRLKARPDLALISNAYDGDGEIGVIEINQRRAPFHDRRFRAAILHAMDREFLVNGLNFGIGRVANSPIPSTAPYHDDSALVKYPFDPARANALLDEMGLLRDTNGIRTRAKMMMLPDGGSAWYRFAQYAKQALDAVGIAVELEAVDWATYTRRNGSWDFDMMWNSYGEYGDPAIGSSRLFLSSNIRKGVPSTNVQGYVNPEADDLFAQAAVAVQRNQAQRLYSRLQHVLTRDAAMLWMFENRPPVFHSRRFRNLITGPNGPSDGLGQASLA